VLLGAKAATEEAERAKRRTFMVAMVKVLGGRQRILLLVVVVVGSGGSRIAR
jgi:hypothetical protein